MDGYRHQELSDETLEKDIEAALGVDPSPEFLPRIRARIANERMQEGWFWSASWRWARVAAVVTAVAVIAVWTLRDPSRAPRQAHVVDTPPVESTPPPVDSALPASALVASSVESPKPVSAPVARAERSWLVRLELDQELAFKDVHPFFARVAAVHGEAGASFELEKHWHHRSSCVRNE